MAKTKISEFNANPALNTDIDSINIAEGCAPSGINDAIRELMSQLKDWQSGTSNDPMVIGSSGSLTLNQGTANGVAYLNGSKVVTSGSALTFDGTNLGVGIASPTFADGKGIHINNAVGSARLHLTSQTSGSAATDGSEFTVAGSDLYIINNESAATIFYNAGSEQMRLTSTGLGIGTSSPAQKLHVDQTSTSSVWAKISNGSNAAGAAAGVLFGSDGGDLGAISILSSGNSPANALFLRSLSTNPLVFGTNNAEKMRLDTSGNLGLGVTPSAWGTAKALQIGGSGFALSSNGAGSGDGSVTWNGYYNGTNWIYSYTGGVATRYRQNESGHAWLTAPSGTAGNAITFTQAMTLTAGGNLFVGSTTAPTGFARVSLVGGESSGTGANSGVQFTYNSSTYGGGAITTVNAAGGGMSFYTFTGNVGSESYTERARIDSSGNLCVGATSKVYDGKISVGFSSTGSQGIALIDNTATTGGIYAYFINSSGNVAGSITHNGTTTVAYNTSSDYRLKDITGPITTSGAYIDSLKPVEGTWKSDGSVFVGLLAHEAQEASRTAVATGTKDGAEMQAMDYSSPEIIANLIAEVKSLRQRVAQLEAQ